LPLKSACQGRRKRPPSSGYYGDLEQPSFGENTLGVLGRKIFCRRSFLIRSRLTPLRPRGSLSRRPKLTIVGLCTLKDSANPEDVYDIALAYAGSHSRLHARLRLASSPLKGKRGPVLVFQATGNPRDGSPSRVFRPLNRRSCASLAKLSPDASVIMEWTMISRLFLCDARSFRPS